MKRTKLSVIAFAILLTYSCKKNEQVLDPSFNSTYKKVKQQREANGMIVLGEKLDNPYSLENMSIALEKLKESNPLIDPDMELSATHYYVKFKPSSYSDLYLLENDDNLTLFTHPLDYEILKEGSFYHDPAIESDKPTYQYASIPKNQIIPNVSHEILTELCILDANDNGLSVFDDNLTNSLMVKSFDLTGNTLPLDQTSVSRSRWTPGGKITISDVGLESENMYLDGAEVLCRKWFTTRKGITNTVGEFTCNGTFGNMGKARYYLNWEKDGFEIRNDDGAKAILTSDKMKGDWNVDLDMGIDNDFTQFYYSIIFSASNRYFYKNIGGIRRPGNLDQTLRIKAVNAYGDEDDFKGSFNSSSEDQIKIYIVGHADMSVFATTIHELTHASHYSNFSSIYQNTADVIKETWARGVEKHLTVMDYPTYTPRYTRLGALSTAELDNATGSDIWYTGLVEDLVDGNGINDRVNGYSMNEIETALVGAKTWEEWRDNIKGGSVNPTSQYVDELFEYWF